MDLLKHLENKLQILVEQHNQFRDEIAALKAERSLSDNELYNLRRSLEDLQNECMTLQLEREEIKQQVEAVLKMIEGLE